MKATIYTLGCKVNSCDSGTISSVLSSCGIETDENATNADIYIVNTCAVTAESERKSRNLIRRLKRNSPEALVIACGCWSRIEENKNTTDADLIIDSVSARETSSIIIDFIDEKLGINAHAKCSDDIFATFSDSKTRASIKIQDGCNRFCSYCLIPYLRGKLTSETPDNIINTVNDLISEGFHEIVLTGIHIASYSSGGTNLGRLVKLIGEKTSIQRIRLGSIEPGIITDEFLCDLLLTESFCPHFHLSLQSGCDTVLKRMNRRYTTEQYAKKCEMIHNIFPFACITTDMITGFPAETLQEYMQSVSFIKRIGFSHVHVFPYSRRKGTKAYDMSGQIPNAIKHERAQNMIEEARIVSNDVKNQFIGKSLIILVEYTKDGTCEGYSENYLRVRFTGGQENINKIVEVNVEYVKDGILYARKID